MMIFIKIMALIIPIGATAFLMVTAAPALVGHVTPLAPLALGVAGIAWTAWIILVIVL